MVGPVLWLAGLGWMADFGAALILWGLASFVIVIVALLVSVWSLVKCYSTATLYKDSRWKFDLVAYPIVGCFLGFVLPWFLGIMTFAHLDDITWIPLRIFMMILGFYGLVPAIYVAFKLLTLGGENRSEDVFLRFWALPSFFLATYLWVSLGLWEGWWHSPYVVVSALVL